jgi:hypothetical protein
MFLNIAVGARNRSHQNRFAAKVAPHDFLAPEVVQARLQLAHGRAEHLHRGRVVLHVIQQACNGTRETQSY